MAKVTIDIEKVVKQHLEESIKKSLEEALARAEIPVKEAAKR